MGYDGRPLAISRRQDLSRLVRIILVTCLLLILSFDVLCRNCGLKDNNTWLQCDDKICSHLSSSSQSPGLNPLPQDLVQPDSPKRCGDRFGAEYLTRFNRFATSYCDSESSARLHCFHSRINDARTDSFCIATPAIFNPVTKMFELNCQPRALHEMEVERGIPRLDQFPLHWYDTGPHVIFNQTINLDAIGLRRQKVSAPKGYSLLVRREGNSHNLWHTMMEIFSLSMTMDILSVAEDPATGKPFYSEAAMENTQVILLDEHSDGPFYDLWRLFTRKPIRRLSEITTNALESTKIILPLPGASNPFWEGDWKRLPCGKSELLRKFSRRILDFYGVPDGKSKGYAPLTLTLIDRKQTRRLVDLDIYYEKLKLTFPSISVRLVDFAAMTFREQLDIVSSTNILAGVHGAGLTHGMFLPSNSTVVEILPPGLNHHGFDNLARFLGHRYLKTYGREVNINGSSRDWHFDDVFIDEEEFLELMGSAIASSHRLQYR